MSKQVLRSWRPALIVGTCGLFLSAAGLAQPKDADPGPSASSPVSPAASAHAVAKPPGQTAPGPGGSVSPSGKDVGGSLRTAAPPPPPPTPAQLRALGLLESEAKEYDRGARDFRNTLTLIVRHHYESKRRRVLSALDAEIGIEKKTLDEARSDAISRLEKFIALYSGENAHPAATPDAMFRLASLYEERGRADFNQDLRKTLRPALDLYRRIIREFPNYEEIAAVHYYLGHGYTDAGLIDEGQQAWRVLVCGNKFQVKDNPEDPERIVVQPLDQDHDQKFWTEWYNRNPVPLDANALGGGRPLPAGGAPPEEELEFRDPYAGCERLPQTIEPGAEPRYVAEIWWQLGNYHFDQIDPNGGPYNLNRAVATYQRSMEYKKPPLYGVAMYKLAWTFFKQQRYQRATEEFVRLLHYADEQEQKTGDPGADFRSEAYTYIAGSLTYVDFQGPPEHHPYIPRNDVLDIETDPLLAEEKMAVAIERVQDPKLIPQDTKWSVEIYKSLAQEYIEITQNRNAITTLELTLQRFPMDRDAPAMQNKVAELYEQVARLSPEGSEAREEAASKALAARTKLKDYVGVTPWTEANKDDPEALQQAEQLASLGLKRAAADHTNQAKALYSRALELSEEKEQRDLLEKAIVEYQQAAGAWRAYYEQDPNALDAYESKFWWADAHYWVVVLQVTLGRSPSPDEIRAARETAIAVRDSNEDDKYLQPVSYYVVTIADKVLEDQYRLHAESEGRRGIKKRDELEFTGEGSQRKVVQAPIPPEVLATVEARDAYNARIPLNTDPEQNGLLYAFQAADTYFLHGHFEAARKRFEPLYQAYCGKNEWGYRAWDKLIAMSNFENNTKESRRLAEAKSCAVNEEQEQSRTGIIDPVKKWAAYKDASDVFEKAQKMEDGPERNKLWREAAASYRIALEKDPRNDSAAEAAINGAYAYKQVGEYDKAIEMYELFIREYGNDKALNALRDGNPKAEPPVVPDRARYEERVGYLKRAYNALASSYVLFFDYPKAAETFGKIASNEHFQAAERRDAARQALSLYTSLDDKGGMERSRQRFGALGASPSEMAEAEFIAATAELKKWDQYSPDKGANANARRRAQSAMENYYTRNLRQNSAAQWVVHAAYWSAKMRKGSNARDTDKWWENTISAFERYARSAPRKDGRNTALGSAEAAMAAEAEYTMLDAEVRQTFDYDTGHHHYKGTAVKVIQEYRKDAVTAKGWHDKLQRVVDKYVSPEWTVVAIARQGSLYDSLRTGLYNARPPELQLFDAATEQKLKRAEESGNLELQEKADEIRMKVQQGWRDAREKELNSADEVMVARYGTAVVLARRYKISNPEVTRAIRRLAFFTDVIGEAKLQGYAARVQDLNYTPGMFTRQRPGMVTTPKPNGLPGALPVVVQP